jgi:hypothetical protein
MGVDHCGDFVVGADLQKVRRELVARADVDGVCKPFASEAKPAFSFVISG